jgi:ribosomal-protein-alanine N-acetyltransferase
MIDKSSNQYIESVSSDWDMQILIDYVAKINNSKNALLLGIFTRIENQHIGNIKLEPIIFESHAYLGILVGETNWRGKKLGTEVISNVLDYCFIIMSLKEIRLGVDRDNVAALKLYLKLGFMQTSEAMPSSSSFTMSIDTYTWFALRSKIFDDLDNEFI